MNKLIAIGQSSGNIYIGDSPESRVDAVINELLNILAAQPVDVYLFRRKPAARAIVKIKHNNIQAKRHIIQQYIDRSAAIEKAYKDIDSLITFGKNIILRNLSELYFAALDEAGIDYLTSDSVDMDKIRGKSDFIIDYVMNKLRDIALGSKNALAYREEIESGIGVIVAHAFIECVILEAPEDDS